MFGSLFVSWKFCSNLQSLPHSETGTNSWTSITQKKKIRPALSPLSSTSRKEKEIKLCNPDLAVVVTVTGHCGTFRDLRDLHEPSPVPHTGVRIVVPDLSSTNVNGEVMSLERLLRLEQVLGRPTDRKVRRVTKWGFAIGRVGFESQINLRVQNSWYRSIKRCASIDQQLRYANRQSWSHKKCNFTPVTELLNGHYARHQKVKSAFFSSYFFVELFNTSQIK